MTSAQKQNLYRAYSDNIDQDLIMGTKMSYMSFINQPNLEVMVDMKCLDCQFALRVNFALYAEYMKLEKSPFPLDNCPHCGKLQIVPIDIYNKLIDSK